MKNFAYKAAALAAAAVLLGAGALGAQEEPEETWVLREYQGCVAVFPGGGGEVPERVTDIQVRLLPALDRDMLSGGITAENARELSALLDDLGS